MKALWRLEASYSRASSKSLEIKSDALIEEQEVEGRTTKPKQAIGYEDAKINVELILYDGPFLSKYQKLSIIQNILKSQDKQNPRYMR